MLPGTVHSAVARLARIGLTAPDHLAAQREALAVVREVIPFDVASFATIDPATVLWTSCVLSGLERDPEREGFMFDNEYRQDDLLKIVDLARKPAPVGRLSEFNPDIRSRSIRHQVLGEHGAVDELRCAIVDRGDCWGSFEIYRTEYSGPFSPEDSRNAALLSQPMARLIRIALLNQAAAKPTTIDEPPGVLVLNANGDVVATSSSCRIWLDEIESDDSVPAVVRALAIKVSGVDEQQLTIVTPRRSGGWVRLHAVPMSSGDEFTVSVFMEPARAPELPKSIASVYGFTPRECEVIVLMARGMSSKEIAVQLGISTHTVNDHVKAVLQKAGAQSRQQLIAALFFDHCLPLRQREAIPGPYGWFLEQERTGSKVLTNGSA